MSIDRGIFAMIPQQPRYVLSRIYGDIREDRYRGPHELAVAWAFYMRQFADDVITDGGTPITEVIVRWSSPAPGVTEIPVTVMETGADELVQSIFLNPTFAGISIARRALLERVKTDYLSGDVEGLGKTDAELLANLTALNFTATELVAIQHLLSGNESWRNTVHWIRRTRTVSRNYPVLFDKLTDNMIWSTGQLAAYTGSPGIFNIPAPIGAGDPPDLNLVAGWLKDPTYILEQANTTFQISESWKLARWSSNLYPLRP